MRYRATVLRIVWAAALVVGVPAALAHKVQVADPAAAAVIERNGGRLLADYGAYRLYESARVDPELLRRHTAEVRDDFDRISLATGPVDTTAAARLQRKASVAFAGKRLHLVQFVGPVQRAWRDALRGTGVQIISYVPANAFLVYGDAAALARLGGLAGGAVPVQWEGDYANSYKIHPRARPVDKNGQPRPLSTDQFDIQLVDDAGANAATLALIDRLKLAPIIRQYRLGPYANVLVRLRAADLEVVAAQPDVISIHLYPPPRKQDERQDQIVAGQLAGNGPSGPGYLAWLAGQGFAQAQFDAAGFVVDVSDSGIDNGTTQPGHFALYALGDTNQPSRVVYNRLQGTANRPSTIAGCDGHGNLNAHIVGGYDSQSLGFPHTDSEGFYYGLGVCPFVRVGSSVVFDPDNFTNPNYADLLADAYQDGARISNNSWGDVGADGEYNSDSQAYDALCRDAQPEGSTHGAAGNQPMVLVFSVGDDGPAAATISPPGTGKNVIAVGGSENVRSLSTANGGNHAAGEDGCVTFDTDADDANAVASFSSRGPCADGRNKPDLVAPCSHITGGAPQRFPPPPPTGRGAALACFLANGDGVCGLLGGGVVGGAISNFFPVGQQFFTVSSGTSHSAPAVAGACALVRQYFINQALPPPGPAMTKAYLMNSARYLTGTDAHDNLWSNGQGLGLLDLGRAFDGVPRVLRDELPADKFTVSGQSWRFTGTIAENTQPFRVTLAWTDAPGSTAASRALNNDLDLTVTVGGQSYRGNVFSGAFSVTGGSADHRNNVESVLLPAGVTGNFTITVTAANINSDGVPGDADPLDQDFALVIYNGVSTPAANLAITAAAVVNESCAPTNGVIDPGETVTVSLALANVGTADTCNLVATLLPAGGVSAPSAAQTYGVVVAGGAAVAREFTFTANGPCGGAITNMLQLVDGATGLGVAVVSLPLGTRQTQLAENFDGLTAPALPGGWTTSASGGQSPWATSAIVADTPPLAAFSAAAAAAGVNELDSPAINITGASAQLMFRQAYDLEDDLSAPAVAYDGGVLEIKIGTGGYQDILQAGGSFASGGYDHTLSSKTGNPLGGRQAWSGNSGGFVTTIVNLPPTAAGKTVQLRWRCATDSGMGLTGWFVDTISVTDPVCCGGGSTTFDFTAAAGAYQGLVQAASPTPSTSGTIAVTVAGTGSFSAKLVFGGALYSFKGAFDPSGLATTLVARPGNTTLTVTLQLSATNGTDTITGTVANGTTTAAVLAPPSPGAAANSPVSAFQGSYTIRLLPNPNDSGTAFPQGIGYGTLKVDGHGRVKFRGTLGDGTTVTQTSVVSADGRWPLYIPLYLKQGTIAGWVTLTNVLSAVELSGVLNWERPATPASQLFPAGFATQVSVAGSTYAPPPAGTPVLAVGGGACNLRVILGGGGLDTVLTNLVTLSSANKISACASNGVALKLNVKTGLFSGSFKAAFSSKPVTIRGALFPGDDLGAGLFLGVGQTGRVILEPAE